MWRLSGSWLWTTAQPWIVFGRPATSFEPSASGNSQIVRCDGTVGTSQSQAHSDTYPDNKIVLYMLLAGLPMAYDTPYWRLQAPRHRHDTSHDPRTGDSGFPFRSVLLVTCKDQFRVPPLRVGSVYGLPPTGCGRPNDNTQFLPKEERGGWWVAFRNKPGSMRDYSNIRTLNYFSPHHWTIGPPAGDETRALCAVRGPEAEEARLEKRGD